MNENAVRLIGILLIFIGAVAAQQGIAAKVCGLLVVLYAIGLMIYGRFKWWEK